MKGYTLKVFFREFACGVVSLHINMFLVFTENLWNNLEKTQRDSLLVIRTVEALPLFSLGHLSDDMVLKDVHFVLNILPKKLVKQITP